MENVLLKKAKIQFTDQVKNYYPEILTDEALEFISALHKNFNTERLALLKNREMQQQVFDQGESVCTIDQYGHVSPLFSR